MTHREQDTQIGGIRDQQVGARPEPREASPAGGLLKVRGLWILFAVAFCLRIVLLFVLDSTERAEGATAWEWGWESACMAETLLGSDPYGDPWSKGTGASAWLTPVYPGIVAGCMALGGGVTPVAAFLLFGLHSVFSAATCLLLVALGRTLGLARAGLWAGWVFALYPAALWNAVTNVWDTTLVAFAVTAFFVFLLRLHAAANGSLSTRAAAAIGLAYGALLMVNPAPLGMAPAVLLFVAWAPGRQGSIGRAAAFLAATALVCSPWIVRNVTVLGTPNLRSNLGVEFHVGNNDLANGRHQTAFHPSHSAGELALYRELGEVAYSKASLHTALEWMRTHPRRTASLVLRRIQIYWVGESPTRDPRTTGGTRAAQDPKAWIKWAFHSLSGLLAIGALLCFRRGTPEGLLFRVSLLLFPVPYYLTHVMERYRFPVDPLLIFLDVWFVGLLVQRIQAARRRSS